MVHYRSDSSRSSHSGGQIVSSKSYGILRRESKLHPKSSGWSNCGSDVHYIVRRSIGCSSEYAESFGNWTPSRHIKSTTPSVVRYSFGIQMTTCESKCEWTRFMQNTQNNMSEQTDGWCTMHSVLILNTQSVWTAENCTVRGTWSHRLYTSVVCVLGFSDVTITLQQTLEYYHDINAQRQPTTHDWSARCWAARQPLENVYVYTYVW